MPTSAWIVDKTQVALLGKLDQPRISAAAALVARAVEQAKLEAFAGKPLPAVAIDTPIAPSCSVGLAPTSTSPVRLRRTERAPARRRWRRHLRGARRRGSA
ncbi:MAG: hypothetical protein IPI67_21050 [Myxococcales bacterium]|nr:hypothetical protein [Myxococcales bacterium]